MAENQLNPGEIFKVGFGFWTSKVLLTAVQFQLFTILAKQGESPQKQIKDILGLKCTDRHVFDFLDTLVGLNFLHRQGLLQSAVYSNTKETDFFLDKSKPSYIGSMLQMGYTRFYSFWADLGQGLKTGKPQNQSKYGVDIFEALYSSKEKLTDFVKCMQGVQSINFKSFAEQFDFTKYKTLLDVGGSGGLLSITVAKSNSHLTCTSMDLPQIEPIAKANIQKHGVNDRVQAITVNFLKEPLPKADVIVMGNILHDWGQPEKDLLIKKAYEALSQGGALVVIESIIDNDRKENVFGLEMSLHMLLEVGYGFNFTHNDFDGWAKAAGFKSTQLRRFGETAVVAYK